MTKVYIIETNTNPNWRFRVPAENVYPATVVRVREWVRKTYGRNARVTTEQKYRMCEYCDCAPCLCDAPV